jgi:hypothetical protein
MRYEVGSMRYEIQDLLTSYFLLPIANTLLKKTLTFPHYRVME